MLLEDEIMLGLKTDFWVKGDADISQMYYTLKMNSKGA